MLRTGADFFKYRISGKEGNAGVEGRMERVDRILGKKGKRAGKKKEEETSKAKEECRRHRRRGTAS